MKNFNTPYLCEVKKTGMKFYPSAIDYKHKFVYVNNNPMDVIYTFDEVCFFRNCEFVGLHKLNEVTE